MIINTTRNKKPGHFATPQTPQEGDSPVEDLPPDKYVGGKTDSAAVINVFSKSNYKHDFVQSPSPTDSDEENNVTVPPPAGAGKARQRTRSLLATTGSKPSPLASKSKTQQKETVSPSKPHKKPELNRINSIGLQNGYKDRMRLRSPVVKEEQEAKRLPKNYSP